WDIATRKLAAQLPSDTGISSAVFSPDGKLLAGTELGTVRVWDLTSKQQVRELGEGRKIQFSPDGKLLAASWNNALRLRDVATWPPVGELPRAKSVVSTFAFAPGGTILATGEAGGTLRLWDVAQKREVASRRIHASDIAFLAFSPDGRRLATSGERGSTV